MSILLFTLPILPCLSYDIELPLPNVVFELLMKILSRQLCERLLEFDHMHEQIIQVFPLHFLEEFVRLHLFYKWNGEHSRSFEHCSKLPDFFQIAEIESVLHL